LRLLVEARSPREIGEPLNVTQHAGSNHVRSVLLKRCASTATMPAWGLRRGLIPG
jgi:hypothetical protein